MCRSYECMGKHWILYWIQENKTAMYFLFHSYTNERKAKLESCLVWLTIILKAYRLSELNIFFILKVANIRCFMLIAVEIFHNIMRK
jgi:hypothetical protein